MTNSDVRWHQRLDSYQKALSQLAKFMDKENLNELEEIGMIQAFEFTHELAWKLLKAFLNYRGVENIYGSKDATRQAFSLGLIEEGEAWMQIIKDRNRTSHTYNQETVAEIAKNIREHFFDLFVALRNKMQAIQDEDA